jgi:2-polyprenyl-6-methoxyphenol hydroxylase-like FAD-dependent oxidoreductase
MQALLPDDVAAKLPRAICNPDLEFDANVESFPVYNGITGDLMFASPMPGSRRISRQRLRSVLAEGLDIQWGKKVQSVTGNSSKDSGASPALTLAFEDGSTFATDFVLGADGAHSRVRTIVVDDADKARSTPSGLLFATAIVNYGDAAKVKTVTDTHPVAAAAMGTDAVGGCGVLYVNDGSDGAAARDPADWTTFWVKIWQGNLDKAVQGQEAIELLKASESSKKLAAPFNQQIEWTPEGSVCYIDEMKYWIPVPFAGAEATQHARVTLAGDAAHPMLIYRGQGFQHAITDVDNYIKALVAIRDAKWDADVRQRVIGAYDAEVIERGAKAVTQSVQEAALSFDVEKVSKMLMARQGHGRSA